MSVGDRPVFAQSIAKWPKALGELLLEIVTHRKSISVYAARSHGAAGRIVLSLEYKGLVAAQAGGK